MLCLLIRHGQDDETLRGGWGQQPLTQQGVEQAEKVAQECKPFGIKRIYTSDLCRATETAGILSEHLQIPVVLLPQFREVNNGELAGMKNDEALLRYPGLFWNQLEWEQCYPDGESPKQFYERICAAWADFSAQILLNDENVALVTHGGVIHVIRSILEGRPYSNGEVHRKVKHAEAIRLIWQNGIWKEL